MWPSSFSTSTTQCTSYSRRGRATRTVADNFLQSTHVVGGVRVELSEQVSQHQRLQLSGADHDMTLPSLSIANRVVQPLLHLKRLIQLLY